MRGGARLRAGRLATGFGVFAAVYALALASGGFFAATTSLATLALLAVAAVALARLRAVELGRLDLVLLGALAALVLWTLGSVAWSIDPDGSVVEAQRTLLYLLAAAVVIAATPRGAAAAPVAGVLAACTAVSLYALARGDPVGYAPALALLAAMGLVLAIGLASAGPAAVALAAAPAMAVLWLAGSLAAVVAAAVGLAVALALRHGGRAAAMLAAGGLAAALAAWTGADALRARAPIWDVAWHAAQERPLAGVGAGGFTRTWWQERPVARGAREAHDLYLETLAELGAVGLALLLAVLAVPLVAAVRARGQPVVPAAAGAYVAYLVHAGAHWDWELPAVTVAALACAAAPLAAARPAGSRRAVSARGRLAAATAVLGLTAAAYAGYLGNAALDRSRTAAALGAFDAAAASAHDATRWAPWSAAPWLVIGDSALRRGDRVAARASFRRGLALDPDHWQLWAGLARAARGAERRTAVRRLAALNPLHARHG